MEGKIYQALGKIMAEVGAVGKNQENTQQGFKFRGIDDFMNALHNQFAKHGVIILPSETEAIQEPISYTDSRGNAKLQFRSRIHFTFFFVSTEDGSMVKADGWGEAADNGDKGYNKCKSIALKYVLMQMFLVPTADIADPDKETPDEITEAPQKPQKRPTEAVKEEGGNPLLDEAIKAVESAKTKAGLDAAYNKYGMELNYHGDFLAALNKKAPTLK